MVLGISDFLANAFELLITNERHYFVLHISFLTMLGPTTDFMLSSRVRGIVIYLQEICRHWFWVFEGIIRHYSLIETLLIIIV